MKLDWSKCRYAIVTKWGPPGGGGEAFMTDTVLDMETSGSSCVWIAFADFKTGSYKALRVVPLGKTSCVLQVPVTPTESFLVKLLQWVVPTVVHHQGDLRGMVAAACQRCNVPVVTGYHFWTGLVKLGPNGNRQILQHQSTHKLEPCNAPNALRYVVSDFMNEVVHKAGGKKLPVLAPVSAAPKPTSSPLPVPARKWVTLMNAHRWKGGQVMLRLVRTLGKVIPFRICQTENDSKAELQKQLMAAVRATKGHSVLTGYVPDASVIYDNTRILMVPSVVDETFCRVAMEGLQRGLPIVTTGAGNIKHLVTPDCAVTTHRDWVEIVRKLYNDPERLKVMSTAALARAQVLSSQPTNLRGLLHDAILQSKKARVMIFCPWAKQGLGIQSRHYARILKQAGLFVCIFSFRPYWSKKPDLMDPEPGVPLHSSPHTREKVPLEGIAHIVQHYNVGTILIPETCHQKVFAIARRFAHLQTIAIPNIEIIRASELPHHNAFTKIFCNNEMTMSFLQGCPKIHTQLYMPGFAPSPLPAVRKPEPRTPMRFLLLGGRNGMTRKQIPLVVTAFSRVNKPYRLTVTSQIPLPRNVTSATANGKIKYVVGDLSSKQISSLYTEHDVCLQVSKHEGLGLGFFEPLQHGLPVISIDTFPHCEIIKNKMSGWLLKPSFVAMKEHKECVVNATTFRSDELAKLVSRLIANPAEVTELSRKLPNYLNRQFNFDRFQRLFVTHVLS